MKPKKKKNIHIARLKTQKSTIDVYELSNNRIVIIKLNVSNSWFCPITLLFSSGCCPRIRRNESKTEKHRMQTLLLFF